RRAWARREAPAPPAERAHAETVGLVVRDARDALFARGHILIAIANEADVGVFGARALRGIQRDGRQLGDARLRRDRVLIAVLRRTQRIGRDATDGKWGDSSHA